MRDSREKEMADIRTVAEESAANVAYNDARVAVIEAVRRLVEAYGNGEGAGMYVVLERAVARLDALEHPKV
jgi:hypothetical protein